MASTPVDRPLEGRLPLVCMSWKVTTKMIIQMIIEENYFELGPSVKFVSPHSGLISERKRGGFPQNKSTWGGLRGDGKRPFFDSFFCTLS